MKKILAIVLALVLVAAVAAGCTPTESGNSGTAAEKKIFRTGIAADWETCDSQVTTNDYTVPLNIFDRLVEIESEGDGLSEIVPGLATEWTVSDDGLVYNFKLRKNVKFHNGEIFKADDVLFTFERMLTLDYARNTDAMTPILGAEAMLEGEATKLEGFKVINDYEIEITLAEPYAPFLANIATPAGSIYNRKATEAAGLDFGIIPEKTVGTGPYYLAEWELNSYSLILAFNDYWNGRAKNDGVRFTIVKDSEAYRMMFDNGDLDEIDFDDARTHIPTYLNDPKWKDQIIYGYRVGVYYYSMNQNLKPFDDVRIRKAFQMAIDRQAILDSPLYSGLGVVHSGVMPAGLIGYNADLPEIKYDPVEAKRLMAEAGYPDGFDMVIAQMTESPTTLAINELVLAMLAKVGIRAEIKQYDEATYFSIRGEGELGAYQTSWSADFNDPDNFFYSIFAKQNTTRRSFNYKNEEAMARVEAARYMTDEDARIKEYQDLEKLIIQEDAVWAPLFALQHLWVVQPWVQNYKPLWNGWSGTYYKDIIINK